MRGILYFDNQKQLDEIINLLTPKKYESMLKYVKINYEKAIQWPLDNDMLYDMYYRNIIKKGVSRNSLTTKKQY